MAADNFRIVYYGGVIVVDSVQVGIEEKLSKRFSPLVMEVENESHRHSGPAVESHFKLTLVSEGFAGLSLVKRHQSVYQLLAEELAGPVHALALHLYTGDEWDSRQQSSRESPDCRGGSKIENS